MIPQSIEIDVSQRRGSIRILARLPEQFVELLFEHLIMYFVLLERLLEGVFPAARFALQPGNCRRQVLNRPRLVGLLMTDDRGCCQVDLQLGTTARALDLHQTFGWFPHSKILTQRRRDKVFPLDILKFF